MAFGTTGLLVLDCGKMELSDSTLQPIIDTIPVSTPLIAINFTSNYLTRVPQGLAAFTQLAYLNFSDNAISLIDPTLFNASVVVSLDFGFNIIPAVNLSTFSNFSSLTFLNMTYNKITNVGTELFALGTNSTMKKVSLDLSYNSISSIGGQLVVQSGVSAFLSLANNKLTGSFDAAQVKMFTQFGNSASGSYLNLSSNSIDSISNRLIDLGSFMTLDLSYNSFTQMDAKQFNYNLSNPQASVSFILDSNRISSVVNRPLTMTGSMRSVSLNGNAFTAVDANWFSLDYLPNQSTTVLLSMRGNAITTVINGPLSIANLNVSFALVDLSYNSFSTIEGGTNWFNLVSKNGASLILRNNSITMISGGPLQGPNVTTGAGSIDLSYNPFITIDSAWFQVQDLAVNYLDLSHCSITSISNPPFTLTAPGATINIDLGYNKFTSISGDAFNITSVRATSKISAIGLTISGNPITTFPTVKYGLIASSVTFRASYLNLTSIPANLITSLTNLTAGSNIPNATFSLDLSYKSLTAIHSGDLVMTGTNVSILLLHHNDISGIEANSLPGTVHY